MIVHAPSTTTSDAVVLMARNGFLFRCPACQAVVVPSEDSPEGNPRPHTCDVSTLEYFA